ncbi:conserved hypothetical protein [Dickeya chrysanthemi Ech1591]|uniref:Uncharacterized protein n=1 Tax=Dickeya chrysanthemi (strain Ech1591) TaxID=561229 RepID=C6CP35_DICC1|nr:hypothetical protein [Dickeya chrysanthemi]ACT08778.1 conserved hypothetical protein [Dickeya chrysanthemi Ech1591]WJM83771.1 hypothetical protein QUF31_11250 [Dickeya chrysanthemi]
MKNQFCDVDELGFPKFTGFDVIRWQLPDNPIFITGNYYLWAYKSAYVVYNREKIIQYAHEENIPAFLLAGIALAEVGGTPERFKAYGVLQIRQMINDNINGNNTSSNATSVGSLAIQLRAAAETIGINPSTLTSRQQLQLSNCLLSDSFNIRIVAKHIRTLILHDYPDIPDTSSLTDEQVILAGSRYNRGIERKKEDFIQSLSAPIGSPQREYSSYGRKIVERKESINRILKGI